MDNRINKLAELLVNYSCKIEEGEKVLIDAIGTSSKALIKQLVKEVYKAKGIPFVKITDSTIKRELLLDISQPQLESILEVDLVQMKQMDAYIGVRADDNTAELSDVPSQNLNLYYKVLSQVLDYRVNNTKWVILRYPNYAMAQLSNMSLEKFEDFYFNVCTLDYNKMSKAMDNLVDLINKTDKVRLVGPGTDLSFSIKGIPAVKCDGGCNIPDGEVYTAPIKDSVNGIISYNTLSEEQGFTFSDIVFEVENGKIIKATSNNTERINEILDTDLGSRYFGEFAIGVNPYILHPMKDTLFDEKIAGSFHLTPGASYEDAFNGNKSALHWDLVMIQREDYGGGEVYFDDQLIRKDGIFLIDSLKPLNPENLL
ncbi:MAG: aminopeptidase [Anaerovoracaceae bacterium]